MEPPESPREGPETPSGLCNGTSARGIVGTTSSASLTQSAGVPFKPEAYGLTKADMTGQHNKLLQPKAGKDSRCGHKRNTLIHDLYTRGSLRANIALQEATDAKVGEFTGYYEFVDSLPTNLEALTEYPCSKEDASQVSDFVPMNSSRQVHNQQLPHIARVWTLVGQNREAWSAKVGKHIVGQSENNIEAVHKLMKLINGDEDAVSEDNDGYGCVTRVEAEWVANMVSTLGWSDTEEQRQTTQMLAVAHWVITCHVAATGTLGRELLVDRLELESRMRMGCCRFLLLVVFFSLFTSTISISGKISQCRSIRDSLIPRFDLESIMDITSLEEVKEYITAFSLKSADMSPTSLSYFGEAKSAKILATPEKFTETKVLPDVDLGMGRGFTMQAWLQIDSNTVVPKGGLPIFRRALTAVGTGSDMSCISWNFPPSIAFGAHDYGMKPNNDVTGLAEEFVKVNDSSGAYSDILQSGGIFTGSEIEQLTMHTLVVDMDTVTFYINDGQVLSTQKLDRMVTDCSGAQSTVGSGGLYLATVLYMPRALSRQEVNEIYQQGALLGNTGYNIQPPTLPSLTHLNEIANKITDNKAEVDAGQVSQQRHTEAQNSLAVLAMRNPKVPPTPYSNTVHPISRGLDPVLGYPVWNILENEFVDASSQIRIPGDALPRATATKGFAISAWLKFKQAGNGYLIARGLPAYDGAWKFTGYSDMCWFVYIGGSATEFRLRSPQTGEEYGASAAIKDLEAPDDSQFRDQSFRHFFAQVDPTAAGAKAKLCIDGECGLYMSTAAGISSTSGPPVDCEDSSYTELRFPDAVQRAEALNRTEYFVTRRPPGLWPLTAQVKNFKMFDRVLTQAEEDRLRTEDPDPEDPTKAISANGGCRNPAELFDEESFIDAFGHNCLWYYQTRMDGLPNCERNVEAARACPVACNSAEVCWGKAASIGSNLFNVWDQQMEIRTTGSWGTTCVAKSTTAAKEAIRCGLNAPNFTKGCEGLRVKECGPVDCSAYEHDREALLNCLGDVVWTQDQDAGPRYRFLPCAEIVRTHVPSCDWDDTGLDEIAAQINASGEFAITFWVESILTEGCLQPQMRFVDGDGLTFAWLGGWEEVVLDPPHGNGCNKNTWYSFDTHGIRQDGHKTVAGADVEPNDRPAPGRKHLVIMGRQQLPEKKIVMSFDTKTTYGGFDAAMQVPPLKANKDFLRVINIAGDVRLSAMQITPMFPEPGTMAKYNYAELPSQSLRRGTDPTLTEQLHHSFKRDVELFKQKQFLVSPPLIAQSRKEAADCNWEFSNDVVSKLHNTALRRHCEEPYQCVNFDKKNVYQCPADEESDLFFGLEPTLIMNSPFYAEFLATITQNPIVVRRKNDGSMGVMQTDAFLDTLTSGMKVMGIFYSPEYEITSNLVVDFIFDNKGITATYHLQHYVALTGEDFKSFILYQWVFLMIVELCLFVEMGVAFKDLYDDRKREGQWDMEYLPMLCGDVALQVVTLIFFAFNYSIKAESESITEDLVGTLVNMQWDSSETGFQDKKSNFLNTFNMLDSKIARADGIEVFGMITGIMVFLRMVWATSVHPRIALISSTLRLAFSDMCHFFAVFLLVLWGFGVIGWWRFGRTRSDFQDIGTSVLTLIDGILGPPGALPLYDEDNTDFEYLFFALLTHIVNFFFLINFFLAIVVDSYVKVVEETEKSVVEQDAISDALAMLRLFWLRWRNGWPQDDIIAKVMWEECDKDYISPADLYPACDFPSKASAKAFYAHYARYEFLQIPHVELTMEGLHANHTTTEKKLERLMDKLGEGGMFRPRGKKDTIVAV